MSENVEADDQSRQRPFVVNADEADLTQKGSGRRSKQAVFKGNVRLTGGGGLEVKAAEATYTERDGDRQDARARWQFTKGRMTGSGVGATYDQNREVLWILDQAKINVTPDKARARRPRSAGANEAGLARAEHYMVLDGSRADRRRRPVIEPTTSRSA